MLMEECGVFGVFLKNESNVSPYIVEGLIALQHRGQEAAGIACSNFKKIELYKKSGTVSQVFNDKVLNEITGTLGIGHVRYSTKGGSSIDNAQPFLIKYKNEYFSIAHNGQIENAEKVKRELEKNGTIFMTGSDTELILHILVGNLKTPPHKWTLEEVSSIIFENIKPSYSLLILFEDRIMAIRDKKGYRPLSIYEDEYGHYISSEDCGFNFLKPHYKKIREIKPGEAVEISKYEVKSIQYETNEYKHCFFEHVYFARPDSNVFGRNVHLMRERLGQQCAIENPVDADIVVPVMESGFSGALGYSKISGIPIELGLMKNRYIGRTFINPGQSNREIGVRRKLSPIIQVIKNKRIVLIDDSIVRGTTMKRIVDMLKEAGANEIHVRIASPAVKDTCSWGVDIPNKKDLIAKKNIEDIKSEIHADSLGYVSLKGIKEILGNEYKNYCFFCFGGK